MGGCLGDRGKVEVDDMEAEDRVGSSAKTGMAAIKDHLNSGSHDAHLKKTGGVKKNTHCSSTHAKVLHGIQKAHEDHPAGGGHGLKKTDGPKKAHCSTKHSKMLHEIGKGHEDHPSGGDGHTLKKTDGPKKHHDSGAHMNLLHSIKKGHEDHASDGHGLKKVAEADKNHREAHVVHDVHKVGDHVILPRRSDRCVYANVIEVDGEYIKVKFEDNNEELWVMDSGLNHAPNELVQHKPHVNALFGELKAGNHDERLKKTEGPQKKGHDAGAHLNLLHEIAKGHEDHPGDGHELNKTEGPQKTHCANTHMTLLHEIGKGHEDHPSDGHGLKKTEGPQKSHDATKHMNLLHEIGKGHEDHASGGDGHALKKAEPVKKEHCAKGRMNLMHEIGKGHEDHPEEDGHGLKKVKDEDKSHRTGPVADCQETAEALKKMEAAA